ncbi:Non-histone protein 10 [Sphaceloma murrayae]|uniref:Non-histone protein 10 n=1 Tax=Sphaceloma murrayae TaxID=2082308 RepID=A0A2K1QR00_9PEZI|nr:Non-histone protein 10 [Sphaceloma murrayae]
MPPPETSTANTPLPPSVEKAYYRKCIELKRRLNEVEEANDAARLRRARLDRAILKMRLERALLFEQLEKRMEYVDEEEKAREERSMADGERERERDLVAAERERGRGSGEGERGE